MVAIFFHVRIQTQKNQQRDRREAASFPLFQRDRTIRVVIDLYHHILKNLKSSFIFLIFVINPLLGFRKKFLKIAGSSFAIRGERIMRYRGDSLERDFSMLIRGRGLFNKILLRNGNPREFGFPPTGFSSVTSQPRYSATFII